MKLSNTVIKQHYEIILQKLKLLLFSLIQFSLKAITSAYHINPVVKIQLTFTAIAAVCSLHFTFKLIGNTQNVKLNKILPSLNPFYLLLPRSSGEIVVRVKSFYDCVYFRRFPPYMSVLSKNGNAVCFCELHLCSFSFETTGNYFYGNVLFPRQHKVLFYFHLSLVYFARNKINMWLCCFHNISKIFSVCSNIRRETFGYESIYTVRCHCRAPRQFIFSNTLTSTKRNFTWNIPVVLLGDIFEEWNENWWYSVFCANNKQ